MGLATAQALAEAGAAVVLADVNEDSVRSTTDELTASGHKALGVLVTSPPKTSRRHGRQRRYPRPRQWTVP
jgi:NAD(P)-dependent dehydrogenase (short-subunit alcohol dehydrogenase family)